MWPAALRVSLRASAPPGLPASAGLRRRLRPPCSRELSLALTGTCRSAQDASRPRRSWRGLRPDHAGLSRARAVPHPGRHSGRSPCALCTGRLGVRRGPAWSALWGAGSAGPLCGSVALWGLCARTDCLEGRSDPTGGPARTPRKRGPARLANGWRLWDPTVGGGPPSLTSLRSRAHPALWAASSTAPTGHGHAQRAMPFTSRTPLAGDPGMT